MHIALMSLKLQKSYSNFYLHMLSYVSIKYLKKKEEEIWEF